MMMVEMKTMNRLVLRSRLDHQLVDILLHLTARGLRRQVETMVVMREQEPGSRGHHSTSI
jgi:hypothetical protein